MSECINYRQLRDTDVLSAENLDRIAELIYYTDEYIYPCMFGNVQVARSVITQCLKNNNDNMFNIQNLYIAEDKERIIGIILWIDKPLHWSPAVFLAVFKSIGITPPLYFDKVCREYFSSYENISDNKVSIINLCIDREYRANSIGTELLASFIHEHPYQAMELYVLEENIYALRLYLALGFKKISVINGFSWDSRELPCFVMEKQKENKSDSKATDNRLTCLGSKCPSHCCKAYSGFSDRLSPIENTMFTDILVLPSEVDAIKRAGYERLIHKNLNGHYIMATDPDGTCHALNNGICDIYDVRPSICKAYPLYLDMFVGICEQKECPATCEKERCHYDEEAIESLLSVYEYWIMYYKNKKCEEEQNV